MNTDTLVGYYYNSYKKTYFSVHVCGMSLWYEECEPFEVDEKVLFTDDTLHDDAVVKANMKRAKLHWGESSYVE